ncbi:hypothetical protein F4777DRAFT_539237 [Nemania sp. FL0916]|nr:hypothetical protein F4777DRAFT_539237 [Nemania sp. FL0916]
MAVLSVVRGTYRGEVFFLVVFNIRHFLVFFCGSWLISVHSKIQQFGYQQGSRLGLGSLPKSDEDRKWAAENKDKSAEWRRKVQDTVPEPQGSFDNRSRVYPGDRRQGPMLRYPYFTVFTTTYRTLRPHVDVKVPYVNSRRGKQWGEMARALPRQRQSL